MYMTSSQNLILKATKTRSRLIWSPTGDSYGLVCVINNFICKQLAHIIPSFQHGETLTTLRQKFSICKHNYSVDMDASSNDACQWAELKNIVDTYLIKKITPVIYRSFENFIPKSTIEKILRMMCSQKAVGFLYDKKHLLARVVVRG